MVGRLAVGAACHHRRGRHRLRRPGPPDRGGSRLELPEGRLHLLSAYLVVPLFALANAGVVLDAASLSAAWGSRVAWGVAVGLLVGKLAGVVGASLVAMRLGWGSLPEDMGGRAGGLGRDRVHRGLVRH